MGGFWSFLYQFLHTRGLNLCLAPKSLTHIEHGSARKKDPAPGGWHDPQGMIAALVIDTANPEYRGTAFGVLNVLTGIVYLIATPLYGWIWDEMGEASQNFCQLVFLQPTVHHELTACRMTEFIAS